MVSLIESHQQQGLNFLLGAGGDQIRLGVKFSQAAINARSAEAELQLLLGLFPKKTAIIFVGFVFPNGSVKENSLSTISDVHTYALLPPGTCSGMSHHSES